MRIALFGASGRTGREVLRLARARDWDVRALVRPSAQFDAPAGVEVVRGSVEDHADVIATLRAVDAVICVFGPRSTRERPFCARATARIVAAMRIAGVRRILCQTGAMVGELPPTVSRPMRMMAAIFRRRCADLAADSAAQERIVMDSGLDWTLVKPPRLTGGPGTGRIHASPSLPVGLGSHASRADVAGFLLDETASARHVGERVYVRS